MAKRTRDSAPPSPAKDHALTLAKLQRIYGNSSVAPDVFGRRPALPSEIERLAQVHQQPAARADEPRQRANNKERG